MRLLYLFLLIPFLASAQVPQWNASFFSENGERFFVIVNAVRQNETPQTNVKVTGLAQPNYKVKIVFEDGALGEVDANIFAPGEPAEMVYNIKQAKDGKYKCRWYSATPLAQLPPPPPTQQVVTYSTEPRTVAVVTPPTGTVTQTTTTTTTTATPQTASVGVNMGGAGINMSVNISDPLLGGTAVQTTQTTTTINSNVSTTGTMIVDQGTIRSNDPPIVNRTPPPPPPPPPVQQGCAGGWPMGESNFLSAMNSIKKQSFDDTKMKMAKQITSANCLTVSQIRRMMSNFSFESGKLDYAKFAYMYCTDRNNYFQVNDDFSFSSSADELTEFIGSH